VTTVGVALATCNGAEFVELQIASILAQTHLPDRIVVMDDASDDDTVARVQRAISGSAVDVVVTRNASRRGVVRNFEAALSALATDVVFPCDQDDVWRADKVALLLAALSRTGAAAAFSDGRLIDHAGKALPGTVWDRTGFDGRMRQRWGSGDPFSVLLRRTVTPGATMAVRQSLLTAALPLSESAWHDDWLLLLAAATSGAVFVAEPLIDYRLHGSNTIGLPDLSAVDRLQEHISQPPQVVLTRNADRFRELHQRLVALGLADRAASAAAAERHARRRLSLAEQSRPAAIAGVLTELRRGDYRTYSNGWRSAVADLVNARPRRR
jgi:glycosyltransferase involved in cell wall biosynthesis